MWLGRVLWGQSSLNTDSLTRGKIEKICCWRGAVRPGQSFVMGEISAHDLLAFKPSEKLPRVAASWLKSEVSEIQSRLFSNSQQGEISRSK